VLDGTNDQLTRCEASFSPEKAASEKDANEKGIGGQGSRWRKGAATEALIASYNVHKCVGMDQRFDPGRIERVIGEIDADILALQEADRRFGARAGLLDLSRLEREYGLIPVAVAGRPKGHGWHGNLLLFREGKVLDVHQIDLPGVEPRGALVVDVDLDAGPLRIVAAHFGLLRQSRLRQAKAILAAVSARSERPTLLLGDLNEWRLGRRSSLLKLDPAFGPLTAALPSFPARFPLFALDRILGNPHDLISGIEVHETPLSRVASDHLPIKAWIDIEGVVSAKADGKIAA
jgi:endonuclease/exonuclease/phosphatase family metal-dependent hydrolase